MLLCGLSVCALAPDHLRAVTPETAKGTGLYGEYYATKDFSGGATMRRTDQKVDFFWGLGTPYAAAIPVDAFAVRWTGEVEPPVTGDYEFSTGADDGARLWVNGKQLIDDWNVHPMTIKRGPKIRLESGRRYSIRFDYFENTGNAAAKLLWSYPGQTEQVIPKERLYVPERVDYLSDLPMASSRNGMGPVERDMSNGGANAGDGRPIAIEGIPFSKGLGVAAESEVVYNLNRLYDDFRVTVGVDDSAGRNAGSVVFEIWVDNVLEFTSPLMRGNMPGRYARVDVTGRNQLRLVVKNGGDGAAGDMASWADAHLVLQSGGPAPTPAPDIDPYLSELKWVSASSGWGPVERDMSNGEQMARDGKQLSIGGRKFTYGLGVHAQSEIVFDIAKGFQRFVADVGVDDEVPAGKGSVVFQVLGDGVKMFESVRMIGGNAARRVDLNVTGVRTLKLVVLDGGDGIGYDHADWAGARLYRISDVTPPPPPPGLPGAPGTLAATGGDARVTLEWAAATGAATYSIYRGTVSNAQAAAPIAMGLTSLRFVDTTVTNGTKYFYKVAGVNTSGIGPRSPEASATPNVPPPTGPGGLTAVPGDKSVKLAWNAVTGATGYNVYRGTASGGQSATPVLSNVTATTVTDTGLTNGVKYYYKLSAVNGGGIGPRSSEVSATPNAVPAVPAGLAATAGDAKVTLKWEPVAGAASYNIYRATASNMQGTTPVATGVTTASYVSTGLVNNTAYFFKVAAVNSAGAGALSGEAAATPVGIPPAPAGLTATAGNQSVTLNWQAAPTAATYNVYRGTTAGGQSSSPVATGLTATTFTDTGRTNGTKYFYKVTALNGAGMSPRSDEASATPLAPVTPPETLSAEDQAIWRLLRRATWGPTQTDFDRVKLVGIDAWLNEQFNTPATFWPDTLLTQSLEWTEEYFFVRALQGNDQLRQRVAWALSQIWVVSGVEVTRASALLPYIRTLDEGAFGNFYDLMRNITLTPAMGEYLDMVNNKKAANGIEPNENFAREVKQLFTIGLFELNPDGTPRLVNGQQVPTYGQSDVLELSRIFTGWTYPDTRAGNPTAINPPFYVGPMEPVESLHDNGAKRFLNTDVPAGLTAAQDLDNALRIIFNHPNVGPFISRQLIQRLVKSNPSPAYIGAVAAVFNNNGQNVRGDLRAVVRAILTHPEANQVSPSMGKLAEPALFITRQIRALGATVSDTPFMSDISAEMSQRIYHPPSVFNYYSPGFRLSGNNLVAPEFQIYTTATAMIRANFAGRLLSGQYGSNVNLNLTAWETLSADAGALVNQINKVAFAGTMSLEMRNAIITAVQATPTNAREKVRTAFYLAFTSSQFQVEH